MNTGVSNKRKSSLLNEEKQLNFFLKDMLSLKKNELEKTKIQLSETKQLHTKTNQQLFDIQQQNEFLKDIRVNLNSKVKFLENSLPKTDTKVRKNTSKTKTDRMFFDQQLPLLNELYVVESLKKSLDEKFDEKWIDNFKKLEDSVLLAKLQVEEIIDYSEKEGLV